MAADFSGFKKTTPNGHVLILTEMRKFIADMLKKQGRILETSSPLFPELHRRHGIALFECPAKTELVGITA